MSNNNQFSISRRKVLAGLGTIGIASAGAGLGTTAFFSDEEAVSASLQAGRVDLLVDYRATYNPWMSAAEATERGLLGDGTTARPIPGSDSILIGEAPMLSKVNDETVEGTDGTALSNQEWTDFTNKYDACENPMGLEYVDGDEEIMFSLVDIKPKDEGEVTLSLHICDNPSYAWMDVFARNDHDNTVYEPEGKDDDDSEGELDDFLYVEAWMDADCSNTINGDEKAFFKGSLASLVQTIEEQDDERGLMLETAEGEKCFVGLHCLAFYWYLPCYVEQDDGMGFGQLDSATHDSMAQELAAKYEMEIEDIDVNVVQTDSVEFGFSFHVEQCRHNMEMCEVTEGSGFGKVDNFEGDADTLFARARYGNNANNGPWELTVGESPPSNDDTNAQYTWTSGQSVPWEFTYDPSTGSTFDFGGDVLTEGSTPTLGEQIVLQTKASPGSSVSVTLDEVMDAGGNVVSLSGIKSVTADGDSDKPKKFLLIPKCDKLMLNDGFSLSGTAVATLEDGYTGSDESLAFDINVE
jgi:predicted ribosomally synthesized peptide with SipW-like signal peptide